MRQRWVARWRSAGLLYEYQFLSLANRMIARLDFKLALIDLGYSLPDDFILEEATLEGVLQWNYPTLAQKP